MIKSGGVIAYPTEGIWGIGGLNTSEIQQKIYLAKKNKKKKSYFQSGDNFLPFLMFRRKLIHSLFLCLL